MQNLSIGISDSSPDSTIRSESMRRSHLADKRRWCRRPWQREEGNNIQIYILEIRLIPHCLRGASSLVLLNCDLSATWYLSRGRSATSNCTRTQPVRSLASSLAIEEFSSWQVPSDAPGESVLGTGPMQRPGLSTPDSRLPTPDFGNQEPIPLPTPDSESPGVHAHRPRACSQCHSGTAVAWAAPAPGEPTGNVR